MSGELDGQVSGLEADRQEVLKAHIFGGARQTPRSLQGVDEAEKSFGYAGAIEPPYNPSVLATLLEHSNALRQNVDSYVTNIDAFGHRFLPIIDLEAADANERLRSYILDRRQERNPEVVVDPTQQVPPPSDEELERAKTELEEKMRAEHNMLKHFFDFCCIDISFATLRRRTRQDIEVTGNGYWEVLRNETGQIVQFEYIAGFTMRLLAQDPVTTKVEMKVKSNDFDYETIEVRRRFRRYVQVFESQVVYFKEFGDPRLVSKKTGRVFASIEEMLANDHDDAPATEVLHFRVHSSKSAYGVPRWIGTLLSVLGSRQAEEVNYMYFENKSVPPLALLVSGGRVSEETVKRIQDFIDNEVKGKKNFHKILVLEAEPAGGPTGLEHNGRMKVDLKPLTGAQHNDALFQGYDERNVDKVGMSFRLPRMLRGDIRDFNRATAEAALEFAEMQVFGPERDEFDFIINRKILPELGVRFWRFVSNAPSTRNAKDLSDMVARLVETRVLTPAEARDLAEGIFNRELRKIDAPWVRQPVDLTLAGVSPPDELAAPGMASPGTPAPALPGTGDAPPVGGAVPTTPGGTSLPGAPQGSGKGSGLTGTDMAVIVTVNEARADEGRGPLMRRGPGGQEEDPDGYLTVAEFKAKRLARGEAVGTAQGEAVAGGPPVAPQKGDLSVSDLAEQGGLLRAGTGAYRRQPPKVPGVSKDDLLQHALQLIALRKALKEAEEQEAQQEFEDAKRAEAAE